MAVKAGKKGRRVAAGLAAVVGVVFLAYGGICLAIGAGMDDAVTKAKLTFPGDPEEALIAMATSEDVVLKDRNRAIWALGQLGDVRALAPLESLLTGKPCDHSAAVCQREVKKALRLCHGGVNITRWAWRKSVV